MIVCFHSPRCQVSMEVSGEKSLEPVTTCATSSDDESDDCSSVSLKTAIKSALKVLVHYAHSTGKTLAEVDQLAASATDLNEYLSRFYEGLRKNDGTFYARNSLISFRYGLQHHFRKLCGSDIVFDHEFKSANKVFSALLVQVKEAGKEIVMYKEPLTQADFKKLYFSDALSISTPTGLQNKVFVDLMVHCHNHRRKSLKAFTRADFKITSDSEGNKYICMYNGQAKNHTGEFYNKSNQKGRMYELPGCPWCPVLSFEKYVSKLNLDCDAFWQVPVRKQVSHRESWYKGLPVGSQVLGNKMKFLSNAAKLSITYTNRFLQATCIGAFHLNEFEAKHSGHASGRKSSKSNIGSYNPYVSDSKNQDVSRPSLSLMYVTDDRTGMGKTRSNTKLKSDSTVVVASNKVNKKIPVAKNDQQIKVSTSKLLPKRGRFDSRLSSYRQKTSLSSRVPRRIPNCKSMVSSNQRRKSDELSVIPAQVSIGGNELDDAFDRIHKSRVRRTSVGTTEEVSAIEIIFKTPNYRYVCTHCCRIFEDRIELTEHIRMHIIGRPNECFICGLEFGRKCELDDHSRVHMGENWFVCSLCNRRYGAKDELDVHTKTHQKVREKSDPCEVSAEKISKEDERVMYVDRHGDEKPYSFE